jgi:hypothetical protein
MSPFAVFAITTQLDIPKCGISVAIAANGVVHTFEVADGSILCCYYAKEWQ